MSQAQPLEHFPVLIIASLAGGEGLIDADGNGTPGNIDNDIGGDGLLYAEDGDSGGAES